TLALSLGVTSAIARIAAGTTTSAAFTVPEGNLLKNPGAEEGEGSTELPQGHVVPIPSWETTSNFTVIQYGVGDFPSREEGDKIGGGANFFGGGPSNAASSASQSVDLSGAAPEIDTGATKATLSAHMGGFSSQGDKGPVDAIFLDAAGTELGRLTLDPVFPADRGGLTQLILREKTGDVPAKTRSVRVVMTAIRTTGSSNDAYFDNLSLTLAAPPPPANSAPDAVDDALTATTGEPAALNVLTNDTDADADTLSAALDKSPGHGSASCDPSGSGECTYTSEAGYVGPDSFTYTASDGRGGSDTATVNVTVEEGPPAGLPELALTKSDSADPVAVGEEFSYVIEVANEGTAAATNVRLDDPLPDDVTFVSLSYSQGFCGEDGGVFCNFGSIGAEGSATVTIVVEVNSGTEGTTISNTADVSADEEEEIHGNNSDTEETTVEEGTGEADLSLTKSDSPDPVGVGEELTYTIEVENRGTATARNVDVTDDLPAGVQVVGLSEECDLSEGSVFCQLPDLDPEATAVVDIIVRPEEDGAIVNTASVETDTPESSTENNSDSESTTVFSCPALGPAVDDSGIVVGESWVECSAADANGVVGAMTPLLPPSTGVEALLTSGSVANAAGPNDAPNTTRSNGTEARGALDVSILKLDVSIPATANCLSFEFVFGSEEYPEYVGSTFNDGFIAELDVSNWSVSGSTISAPSNFAFDPSGGIVSVNSQFFQAGTVVTDNGTEYDGSTPRLRAQTPVTPGLHSVYLSIFDAGDDAYDSGAFIDYLRAGTTVEGACESGATENGAPTAVNDVLTTAEDTTGAVDVLANDTDPDEDTLTVTTPTPTAAHGGVTCETTGSCTYTPNEGFSGEDTFDYSISDGNGGADTGTVNVTVTEDTPPPPAPPAPTPPAPAPQPAPQAQPADLTVELRSSVETLADTLVTSAEQRRSLARAAATSRVTYTITVTNNGPGVAHGVSVNHQGPGSATFESVSTDHGSCSSGTSVTCSLGTLAVGEQAHVTHVLRLTEGGEAASTASVSATETDPSPANNSVTGSVTIEADRTPLAVPPPVFGQSVNAVFTGTVLVNGVRVTDPSQIPLGAIIDVTN
ncbi:MAG: Ig-like domain-containing protein, partial [Gaiellaceae bacterium]